MQLYPQILVDYYCHFVTLQKNSCFCLGYGGGWGNQNPWDNSNNWGNQGYGDQRGWNQGSDNFGSGYQQNYSGGPMRQNFNTSRQQPYNTGNYCLLNTTYNISLVILQFRVTNIC